MVFNTITVGSAIAPTVIETYFSHYLKRKPLHQKPTAHISYHEGLELIRQFLYHASFHTVEDIQGFTSQYVPSPHWVKVEEVTIPQHSLEKAAILINAQLGHRGVDKVGGSKWWQWRREGSTLKAEWIEMKRDRARRKLPGAKGNRVMLYVHGGAYFFGSVDEHRYQIQRHAPRYRLAPQFPFPCGLHDCVAAYLDLLAVQEPSTIVLAGDSAGGGMVLSMLVILRDQGVPLPAGAILISPWVDLTHSFPSVAGDNRFDYIPAHGFLQRPSAAWPPPNSDDMEQIALHAVEKVARADLPRKSTQRKRQEASEDAVRGFSVAHQPEDPHPKANANNPAGSKVASSRPGDTIPRPGHDLSIMIDGDLITIKDQIQMYATNQLISHPLVSPVLQASLGGLPPLLILTGGGEVLRDEQIYLAHKASNPSKYPPSEACLNECPDGRDAIDRWRPTDVQLQVWDDLCHVAPTLSFTRPAKFMYRSIAQFGAWALARAQEAAIEITDDDDISVISSESDTETDTSKDNRPNLDGASNDQAVPEDRVGKAGDPLPPFKNHMIRQRVDRHGFIYSLAPPSSLPGLQVPPDELGEIKPGPVRKWLHAKKEWDTRFSKEKRRVQEQRIKEMAQGYQGFENDEVPPPSALAGRRGLNMPREEKRKLSWGMSLWSLWGSSHDDKAVEREKKADRLPDTTAVTPTEENVSKTPITSARSRSRSRVVTDAGQTNSEGPGVDENTPAAELFKRRRGNSIDYNVPAQDHNLLSPSPRPSPHPRTDGTSSSTDETPTKASSLAHLVTSTNRPTADGVAFPFKLGRHLGDDGANASTVTLTSQAGVTTPMGDEGKKAQLAGQDDLKANVRGLLGSRQASGDGVLAMEKDMGHGDGEASEGHQRSLGWREDETERPVIERFKTAREEC